MSRYILCVIVKDDEPVLRAWKVTSLVEPYDMKIPNDVELFTLIETDTMSADELEKNTKLIALENRCTIYIPDYDDCIIYIIGKLRETCGTEYVYNPKTGKIFPLSILSGRRYQVIDI